MAELRLVASADREGEPPNQEPTVKKSTPACPLCKTPMLDDFELTNSFRCDSCGYTMTTDTPKKKGPNWGDDSIRYRH